MNIAVTGATGFLGRYVVNHLVVEGHRCRCWYRPQSDRGGFVDERAVTWVPGGLDQPDSVGRLLESVDAVVHAGVYQPPWGGGHRGAKTDAVGFADVNVIGSLRLIQAARGSAVERFVVISSCGVHDLILDDRPLDETHPLWPLSHYGASKAAVEMFVHSFGLPHRRPACQRPTHDHLESQDGWGICALRPVGIYGVRRPLAGSKWFELVRCVLAGEPVDDISGGKEVHAEDVARAVSVLIATPTRSIAGRCFHCCDLHVTAGEVAEIACVKTGSHSPIGRRHPGPKHQITSAQLQSLGMRFGGRPRLDRYIGELIAAISDQPT